VQIASFPFLEIFVYSYYTQKMKIVFIPRLQLLYLSLILMVHGENTPWAGALIHAAVEIHRTPQDGRKEGRL